MKIIYSRQWLLRYSKGAFKSFLTGFVKSAWAIALVVINLATAGFHACLRGIRSYPCVTAVVTFMVMATITLAVHVRMKVKLTTAEWQRDSIERRFDSVMVLYGNQANYYKYQTYKGNKK